MKEKCDHVIGFWKTNEGGELMKLSESDHDFIDTYFTFCPECGENIGYKNI